MLYSKTVCKMQSYTSLGTCALNNKLSMTFIALSFRVLWRGGCQRNKMNKLDLTIIFYSLLYNLYIRRVLAGNTGNKDFNSLHYMTGILKTHIKLQWTTVLYSCWGMRSKKKLRSDSMLKLSLIISTYFTQKNLHQVEVSLKFAFSGCNQTWV